MLWPSGATCWNTAKGVYAARWIGVGRKITRTSGEGHWGGVAETFGPEGGRQAEGEGEDEGNGIGWWSCSFMVCFRVRIHSFEMPASDAFLPTVLDFFLRHTVKFCQPWMLVCGLLSHAYGLADHFSCPFHAYIFHHTRVLASLSPPF
jgi:hypothetical protein